MALGSTVTLDGNFGSSVSGSTLVDGVFLPASTEWETGTVWWDTNIDPINNRNSITLKLKGQYVISGFIVQADDNDSYRVEYWDANASTWKTAWDVPNYDALGWGMTIRPNPNDNSEIQSISPITTSELRFTAVNGDGYYSVSEIQAFSAVPEPSTWITGVGICVGMLGTLLRRARK